MISTVEKEAFLGPFFCRLIKNRWYPSVISSLFEFVRSEISSILALSSNLCFSHGVELFSYLLFPASWLWTLFEVSLS